MLLTSGMKAATSCSSFKIESGRLSDCGDPLIQDAVAYHRLGQDEQHRFGVNQCIFP